MRCGGSALGHGRHGHSKPRAQCIRAWHHICPFRRAQLTYNAAMCRQGRLTKIHGWFTRPGGNTTHRGCSQPPGSHPVQIVSVMLETEQRVQRTTQPAQQYPGHVIQRRAQHSSQMPASLQQISMPADAWHCSGASSHWLSMRRYARRQHARAHAARQ